MKIQDSETPLIQTNLQNNTIHEMFQAYVCHQTNQARIFYADQSMSYRKLQGESNSVARYLLSEQLQIENIVGVLMDRSINAIVSQLGILKAGGAYLPISPNDFPVARIQAIVEEANVNYIVSQKNTST